MAWETWAGAAAVGAVSLVTLAALRIAASPSQAQTEEQMRVNAETGHRYEPGPDGLCAICGRPQTALIHREAKAA